MIRLFFFLVGFGLTVIGSVYIISYLNLLSIGYNFLEYVHYVIRHIEWLNALFGIIIMFLALYKGEKNDIHIWCNTKF